MEYTISLSMIGLAGLIHASFQLSVSTLTLMSGHALGRQQSSRRLAGLVASFILGVIVMTTLIVMAGVYGVGVMIHHGIPILAIWSIACAELAVVGVATWLFYFRPGQGTALWVPRSMARFLAERCKKTKSNSEAFALGLVSVIGELIFLVAPLTVAILSILQLSLSGQVGGTSLYVLISVVPLLIVFAIIHRRSSLGRMQKWREENKKFIQFMAGSAMLIMGFFIYVNEIALDRGVNGWFG